MSDPRNNPDDAYTVFMAMDAHEWLGLAGSLARGGVLTPAEQEGYERALVERRNRVPVIRYYRMSNAEIIGRAITLHNLDASDYLRYRVDRTARVIVDDHTGLRYTLPDDWDLT